MKTDNLIAALGADARRTARPLSTLWWLALPPAVVIAALILVSVLGMRQDIGDAMHTMRFLFKFIVAGALAVTAFAAVRTLSRPEGGKAVMFLVIAAPLLLAVGIAAELLAVPSSEWSSSMMGKYPGWCLAFVPLMGLGPLAIFLAVLRQSAPARPALAGAAAGLLAGGLAALLYATHCTDDSPLFVATWYSIGVLGLTALGALGGRLFVRW